MGLQYRISANVAYSFWTKKSHAENRVKPPSSTSPTSPPPLSRDPYLRRPYALRHSYPPCRQSTCPPGKRFITRRGCLLLAAHATAVHISAAEHEGGTVTKHEKDSSQMVVAWIRYLGSIKKITNLASHGSTIMCKKAPLPQEVFLGVSRDTKSLRDAGTRIL